MRCSGVLAAVAALTLAGCGTTVPVGNQAQGTSSLGQGSTTTAPTASGELGGSGPAGSSGSAGSDGGAPTSGSGATTGPQPSSLPGSAGSVASGVATGVTASTITIGVSYAANAGAANAAIGGKGITTGDEKTEAQTVIADLNKRGGLLGRKLVPLFYVRDAQSTQPSAQQAQAECTFYTQDHKVFAVLQGNGPIDWQTKPCLQRKGVPAITAHITSLDDDASTRTPHADVTGMSIGRMATAMVSAVRSRSWLSPWNTTTAAPGGVGKAKVGLLGYDLPEVHRAVSSVIVPGLRAQGATMITTSMIYIPVPGSTADTGAAAASVQSAVLRMRSDGVTHLVFMDQGGALTLFFANEARAQSFYPRYLGSSSNGFHALLSAGNIQAKVLEGAVGAGWEPVIDIPASPRQTTLMGPQAKACLALLGKAGLTFADPNARAVGLAYCDKVSLLAHVVRLAGSLTPSAYVGALDRLGDLVTARGVGSRFGPRQHDGAAAFYDLVFDGSCSCMAYVGSKQRLS
jgi:hypothetical protein